MIKLINWADGKKTYLTVAIGIGLGIYQAITGTDISTHWYFGVALTALGFSRAGVAKNQASSKAATAAVESLLDLLEQELAKPQEAPVAPSQASTEALGLHPVGVAGETVVIGQPTPANLPENSVTDALNKLEASK